MQTLKILSFNIWGIYGPKLEDRWQCASEEIKKLNPDIICLQEATDINLLNKLSEITDKKVLLSDCDETGLSILSSLPNQNPTLTEYSVRSPLENYIRKFISVRFVINESDFLVTNTHLSWKPSDDETRKKQANQLCGYVSSSKLPTLLCGDFNCEWDSDPMEIFRQSETIDLAKGFDMENKPTWDNKNHFIQSHTVKFNDRRIDLILLSNTQSNNLTIGENTYSLRDCKIVLNNTNEIDLYPSDHYGVLATFDRN